jgi:hypothetical protein
LPIGDCNCCQEGGLAGIADCRLEKCSQEGGLAPAS